MRKIKEKVLVKCFGFNGNDEKYKEVMFRVLGGLYGRFSKSLLEAIKRKAKFLLIGSGGSEVNLDGVKIKEADYTFKYALDNFNNMFGGIPAFSGRNLKKIRKKLEKIAILDRKSRNTREEARYTVQLAKKMKVDKIILVSDPVHLPRCLWEVMKTMYEEQWLDGFSLLEAQPSHIPYKKFNIEINERPKEFK